MKKIIIMLAACGSQLAVMVAAQSSTTPKMPTFFASRQYPGLASFFVQAADTNGDGILDLITNGGGYVIVEFGNGDGTFRRGPLSNYVGSSPNCFTAIDLTGSGVTDLVMAVAANPTEVSGVVVSMGNGDGTFQPGTLYPVNDLDVDRMVLGDFNGDGIPDIAITGMSGVWLLTGKGGGLFNPAVLAVPLQGANNIAMADFNGDGNLDVVTTLTFAGTSGGGTAVALGNGNGTFQTPQIISVPKQPGAIVAGPLTKGGPPGFFVNASGTSYVFLYFGNGKGGFSGPRLVNLPVTGAAGMAFGDVNGDGLPDLVSEGGYVAFGVGAGYFTKAISYPIEPGLELENVVLADLENNGRTDIVINSHEALSVLLNLGKGYLEDGIWTSVSGGVGCGAKGDFNGDGLPDLAVNTPTGISIFFGTGQYLTPYKAGQSLTLASAGCLVAGDINGDGKPDLLAPGAGTVVAFLNNGDGTFTQASTTVTPAVGYLALGDFNHDGKLDFATSGNLLALGNGDGTFQAPTDIVASPPDSGFSGIAVGDINNDGWPDLVLKNNGIPYNNLTVLLNNHQGGFTQVPASIGALTTQPILADVNGDGKLDVILLATSSGEAVVCLGDGTGNFTFQVNLPGPIIDTPGLVFVADLNGDGVPDIGVLGGDTLNIYLGQGAATYATPFAIGTGPEPSNILTENLHGQAVKANLPDIVVPDASGGIMVLLNLTQ